jgi:ribonucleoside-diphosphate reductase alpha chain
MRQSDTPSNRRLTLAGGEQGLPANGACFAAGTRITTNRGLEAVEALLERQDQGEEIVIGTQLNGGNNLFAYRPATVIYTGKKDTVRLTLGNGQSLQVTPDHQIYTDSGWKKAGELSTNDKVMTQTSMPQLEMTSSKEEIELWQMFGWFTGDGWFTGSSLGLTFAPGKEPAFDTLLPVWRRFTKTDTTVQTQANGVRMIATEKQSAREQFRSYGFKEGKGPTKRVPSAVFTAPIDCRISYLQGLFSADGTKEKKEHTVSLSSASLELLRDVQLLLLTLGIKGRIGWYPVRKRGHSQGNLRISGESCMRFADVIGFPFNPKNQKKLDGVGSKNVTRISKFFAIKSVEPGGVVDVYDLNEPVTHSLIAEGMVVHNCNLGHLVLPRFVKGDWTVSALKDDPLYETINASVDYVELERAIRLAVRFQDACIDYSLYPTLATKAQQAKERRVGIGTMGLGTMLIMLGLRYGSDEAIEFIDDLYKRLAYWAYDESMNLAREKGAFPAFEYEKFAQSGFMRRLLGEFPDLDEKLRKHGIRNVTLLTQAPTGTTGSYINLVLGKAGVR